MLWFCVVGVGGCLVGGFSKCFDLVKISTCDYDCFDVDDGYLCLIGGDLEVECMFDRVFVVWVLLTVA